MEGEATRKMGRASSWTPEQETAIRELWPSGRAEAVMEATGLTDAKAIDRKAFAMGLRRDSSSRKRAENGSSESRGKRIRKAETATLVSVAGKGVEEALRELEEAVRREMDDARAATERASALEVENASMAEKIAEAEKEIERLRKERDSFRALAGKATAEAVEAARKARVAEKALADKTEEASSSELRRVEQDETARKLAADLSVARDEIGKLSARLKRAEAKASAARNAEPVGAVANEPKPAVAAREVPVATANAAGHGFGIWKTGAPRAEKAEPKAVPGPCADRKTIGYGGLDRNGQFEAPTYCRKGGGNLRITAGDCLACAKKTESATDDE